MKSLGPDPWGVDQEPEPDEKTIEGLLELLNAQASLLVSVATGGPRIESVNYKYIERRTRLNAGMRARGLNPPFPFEDLWGWHGRWAEDMPKYSQRRAHIADMAGPARRTLEKIRDGIQVADTGGSGDLTWSALEDRVEGVVNELRNADSHDDLQDVGRRCREILIDAGKLLASPAIVPAGHDAPKAADAKAWLDLFLASKASGGDHKELRAFIRAAWDLAQKVTHGTVERVEAFAAAQATVLVVRSLQQLA